MEHELVGRIDDWWRVNPPRVRSPGITVSIRRLQGRRAWLGIACLDATLTVTAQQSDVEASEVAPDSVLVVGTKGSAWLVETEDDDLRCLITINRVDKHQMRLVIDAPDDARFWRGSELDGW